MVQNEKFSNYDDNDDKKFEDHPISTGELSDNEIKFLNILKEAIIGLDLERERREAYV